MDAEEITKPDPRIRMAADLVGQIYKKEGMFLHWPSDEPITIRGMIERTHNQFLIDLANTKDLDLFNKYAQLWINLNANDLFAKTSNTSDVNDMLANPTYWDEEKGQAFMMVSMSPNQYKLHAKSGFQDWSFTPEDHLIKEYTYQTLEGSKMPLIYLRYTLEDGVVDFSQEGRHRAEVAEILGAEKIPVMVIAAAYPVWNQREAYAKHKQDVWDKFA